MSKAFVSCFEVNNAHTLTLTFNMHVLSLLVLIINTVGSGFTRPIYALRGYHRSVSTVRKQH